MTGLRPETVGVLTLQRTDLRITAPGVITLPQHFKHNGYTTTGGGKIFDFRSVDSESDRLSWSEGYSGAFRGAMTSSASRLSGQSVSESSRQNILSELKGQGNTWSTKSYGANASVVLSRTSS